MTKDEVIKILRNEETCVRAADNCGRDCANCHLVMDDKTILEAYDTAIEMLSEPERKTGKWIPQNHNKTDGMVSTAVYYYPKCSVCGHCASYTNFCPNCGADMRGEEHEPTMEEFMYGQDMGNPEDGSL